VRWKPSAGSRSLTGIFSLEHPHRAALARIGPAQATPAFGPRPRLALPVRQDEICEAGYRTFHVGTACATYFVLGGLKGRGSVAASEASGVASAAPIRAGGAESTDMPLSDRQRPEGFQLSPMSAVRPSNHVSLGSSPLEISVTLTPERITRQFRCSVSLARGEEDSRLASAFSRSKRRSPRVNFLLFSNIR